MHRLSCVVVIGALALVASVVMAAPAGAAKGGNSVNAHACQQGGHESRFEAATGNPFKNAGDCTNDGAQGMASTELAIDLSGSPYACPSPNQGSFCWGNLLADGLAPGAQWEVENQVTHAVLASGNATSSGTVPPGEALNLPCSVFLVQLSSTTSGNVPITESNLESPC